MGTTVATNALLERKGEPFGLVLTQGFADMIEIGDQTRPDLFDLALSRKAKVLYRPEDVVQADERVTLEGWSLDPSAPSVQEIVEMAKGTEGEGEVVIGLSGEAVRILRPLGRSPLNLSQSPDMADLEKLEKGLQTMYDRGLRALAVCLIHSYTYPLECSCLPSASSLTEG
jgi:5-oxoprolinase (ATP-hydrolysing)